MPDISVVVTVHNLKDYIRDCLDSIIIQEGVELEIICVDDASIDESGNILREYAKKDSRIKIITLPENRGLASARNEGFRQARGEYFYNIDGDDLLISGALKRMYTCAKKYDLDLLAFSAKAFFDEEDLRKFGTENDYVRKYEYSNVYTGPELFAMLIKNGDRAAANRVLYFYKATFFRENNLFDQEGLRYADDSMFAFYMSAKRAMCIPDQLYLRRYRKGSVVTSALKKRYLESMVVLIVSELCKWRNMAFEKEINCQIEKYFDIRMKELYGLKAMFQTDMSEMPFLEEHPVDNYFFKRFIDQEPLFINFISKEQLDLIKQAEQVILYGAGYMATEVAKVLEYYSITDYKVVVTKCENNAKIFRGRRIQNINDLMWKDTALIVVAMADKHKDDVMGILNDKGFYNVMWISLE